MNGKTDGGWCAKFLKFLVEPRQWTWMHYFVN
jgi:hypothetical protein